MKNNKAPKKIFYGWWLVLVCILIQAVGYGSSLYLYSVLIGAIGVEFESGRFVLMIGVSGMLLLTGLMSPKVGSLLDRFPIKRIVMLGALIMGSGFILMAFSPHISMVIICYALFISLGMTILSPLTCGLLLCRWFTRYRGFALGTAALGTQLGGVVFPPVTAYFIGLVGWRLTVAGLGVFIIVFMLLLAWIFIYDHPKNKGLQALGEADEDAESTAVSAESGNAVVAKFSLKKIYSSRNFIIVVMIMAFMSIVYSGLLSNLSLIAIDKGQTLEKGALLVSLLSMAGMISSPLMGRVSDLLSVRATLAVLCLSAVLSLVLFLQADSFALLVAAVICFGFFGGAVVPVWSAVISRLYEGRIYGRVFGASTAIVYSLAAFSAPAIGLLYDITASYQATFLVLFVASIVLVSTIFWIRGQAQPVTAESLNAGIKVS
jgi:MFS family permease